MLRQHVDAVIDQRMQRNDPLVSQRAHAVRAHLLDLLGDHDHAAHEYRAAAELTANDVERRYLLERISRRGDDPE